MTKGVLLSLSLLLVGGVSFGQTVNYGGLYIKPNTEMSSLFSMENKEDGTVFNNGKLYLYSNLKNDGLFDFVESNGIQKSGQTIFSSDQPQLIEGEQLIRMNNIVFQNTSGQNAISLETGILTKGVVEFQNGIVNPDPIKGSFVFLDGATAFNANDDSYINGLVDKEGNEAFVFPVGNKGYYRNATISAPANAKDVFVSEYVYDNKQFFATLTNASTIIKEISKNEYWLVKKAQNVEKDVFLKLGWDERTTDPIVLTDPEKDLHIIRWDEKQLMWVDEGGVVDMVTKTVTTVAPVKGYGLFALATVNTQNMLEGDIVIYNIVTSDDDEVNDYFLIDNIRKYPNNTVQIYNRWGAKVFETRNYDSNGNVFKGYSDNEMTMGKREKLPSGTYYYILNYQYEKDGVSKPIKKAGYLHLETK